MGATTNHNQTCHVEYAINVCKIEMEIRSVSFFFAVYVNKAMLPHVKLNYSNNFSPSDSNDHLEFNCFNCLFQKTR